MRRPRPAPTMSERHPSALVVGDFSGNNLGHNALLVAIVAQLAAEGGIHSVVPSLFAKRLRPVLAGFPEARVIGGQHTSEGSPLPDRSGTIELGPCEGLVLVVA